MHGKGRHADSDISSTGLYAAVAVAALGGAAVNTAVEKYRGLMDDDYLLDKAYKDLYDAYLKANDAARTKCHTKIKHWFATNGGLVHINGSGGRTTYDDEGEPRTIPPRRASVQAVPTPPAADASAAADASDAAAGDADADGAGAAAVGT